MSADLVGGAAEVPPVPFAVRRDLAPVAGVLSQTGDAMQTGELQTSARIDLTDAERAEIAARPDLVLGVDGDWAPLIIRNPDGSLGGIDADTAALVDRAIGTRIRFEVGRWAELVARAERRELDGLSASAAHPERAGLFLFTAPYTEISKGVIFVRAGNPLGVRQLDALAGRRVAHLRGNLTNTKSLAKVPAITAVPVDSFLEGTNQLLSGGVDALIADEAYLYWLADRNIASVQSAFVLPGSLPLVWSIRKDRPLLVSAIDKALTALPWEQRLAFKRRYLGGKAVMAPAAMLLSDAQRDYLRAKGGVLTYCFNPFWTPYDYLEGGAHRGVFREYLDLVCAQARSGVAAAGGARLATGIGIRPGTPLRPDLRGGAYDGARGLSGLHLALCQSDQCPGGACRRPLYRAG